MIKQNNASFPNKLTPEQESTKKLVEFIKSLKKGSTSSQKLELSELVEEHQLIAEALIDLKKSKGKLSTSTWTPTKTQTPIHLNPFRAHTSSQQYLEKIIASMADTLIVLDQQFLIKTINPSGCKLLGYEQSDLIEKPFQIITIDLSEMLAAIYTQESRGETKGFFAEQVMKKRDGERIDVYLSCAHLKGYKEEVIGYVCVIQDLTERKKLEKMKNDFISMVSHELRTPLTSIQGSLGLINSGMVGELSTKTNLLIEIAYRNCQRLIRLINDLLDIDKIESGHIRFDFCPLDIGELLEQAIEANQAYAEKFEIRFELENYIKGVKVYSDPDRLMQVMTNLLSNAVKFSPKGGQVKIRGYQKARGVRVEVIDLGLGIPDEAQDKIFQKFYQADISSSRRQDGTGLGLSVCKVIMERLSGRLSFASELGEGSTFFFELEKWTGRVKPETFAKTQEFTFPKDKALKRTTKELIFPTRSPSSETDTS